METVNLGKKEQKETLPQNIDSKNISKMWSGYSGFELGLDVYKGEKLKINMDNFFKLFYVGKYSDPDFLLKIEASPVIESIKEELNGKNVSIKELRKTIENVVSIYYEGKDVPIENETKLDDEELSIAIDCWNSDSYSPLRGKSDEFIKKIIVDVFHLRQSEVDGIKKEFNL